LTPELAASEGHTSNPDNGYIPIELQFSKALAESITCPLYLEYENSVLIDIFKSLDRFLILITLMDTVQIICILRNVRSFLGVYPSDLLPYSIKQAGTVIINTDPHTQKSHIGLRFISNPDPPVDIISIHTASPPFIPTIQSFLRRNCTVWDYNTVQLQVLRSTICGHNCCLFALYMDRGITPKQFVGLFISDIADRQITELFASEFGSLSQLPRGGQCCTGLYKW
jgi:hypothetical protein